MIIAERIAAGMPHRTRYKPAVRVEQRDRAIALPWHRVVLGLILALAAGLNFWQLDRVDYGNTYYAAAVRSMMQSWHNFFFAAFDPGGIRHHR